MSTIEIRFTPHTNEQLAHFGGADGRLILDKLEEIRLGRFPRIKISLQSVPLKGEADTYLLKLGHGLHVVYSEATDENGQRIYLIQSAFRKT